MEEIHKEKPRGTALLIALILSVTLLIKFAVRIGGAELFLAYFLIFATIGYGIFNGILELHKGRLMAFSAVMGAFLFTQIFNVYTLTISSLAMLMVMQIPYIFILKKAETSPGAEIIFFRNLMLFFSILGIIQYFSQYVIGDWAFFMDSKMPSSIIRSNFNGMNAIDYMGSIYKSTAVFLQEPSNFSQLLAIAIIIEILYFRSPARMGFYLFALALTFSGTGLIPLLLITPVYLIHKKHYILFMALACIVVTAPIWSPYVGLDKTVSRATEIQNQHSSGYARFISPYLTIKKTGMFEDPVKLMFGNGAGGLNAPDEKVDYELASSTWGKIFYEYGMLGSFAYILFIFYVVCSSGKNPYIIGTIMIIFWLAGEYMMAPTVHTLIFALLAWPNYKEKDFLERLELKRKDKEVAQAV